MPILKSFSAGRPKIFACCSVVALLLQRWLNYRGLLSAAKTEGENKESPTELFFFEYQRQNIKTIKVMTRPSIQSVQRSHNDFLRPMKHDLAAHLAASDEVATWKAWELARICFHSSLYDALGQTEP